MKPLYILFLALFTLSACNSSSAPPEKPAEIEDAAYTTTPSGLKYHDLKQGSGPSPQKGQTVVVHYTGWLTDGKMFDSSVLKKKTFSFTLGTGGVIPGWDEGVATMKVGGTRQLSIPPDLAYGEAGVGNGIIPPNATLIFQIELLEIH
ncbi:MAG: FKBP-type peptidyl-prolyl cis-trans isomerase [bacterium]|nr:FKBP-type peptidyl-prolyl cis-trans isomerase [bacterium]